jgi:hypothetical protein
MNASDKQKQAVRKLRTRLLDVCLEYDEDDETGVCAAALFEALAVVLACSAPTPADAKRVLMETLECVDLGIDSAWAEYRRTEQ